MKFIIPHGGGAVPFHWGRFRGIALNNGKPELAEIMGKNIFFDTCVYHQPGIDLLTKVVPVDNILFASEMVGAVKGNDPRTGFGFDDTKRYVDEARRCRPPTRRRFSKATRCGFTAVLENRLRLRVRVADAARLAAPVRSCDNGGGCKLGVAYEARVIPRGGQPDRGARCFCGRFGPDPCDRRGRLRRSRE